MRREPWSAGGRRAGPSRQRERPPGAEGRAPRDLTPRGHQQPSSLPSPVFNLRGAFASRVVRPGPRRWSPLSRSRPLLLLFSPFPASHGQPGFPISLGFGHWSLGEPVFPSRACRPPLVQEQGGSPGASLAWDPSPRPGPGLDLGPPGPGRHP